MKLNIDQQQKVVRDLFDFFNNPDERLMLLKESDRSYNHFYSEYHKKDSLKLDVKQFELLMSKSSHRQVALALNCISLKCSFKGVGTSEIELLESYTDEILTIFSLNLWFNNFEYGIDEIFVEFPEFKKQFESKIEKGMFDMVSASSMWELFLKASSNLQEKMIIVAIRENLKHTSGSLDFSKRIAKMK